VRFVVDWTENALGGIEVRGDPREERMVMLPSSAVAFGDGRRAVCLCIASLVLTSVDLPGEVRAPLSRLHESQPPASPASTPIVLYQHPTLIFSFRPQGYNHSLPRSLQGQQQYICTVLCQAHSTSCARVGTPLSRIAAGRVLYERASQ
jgi:hypothetical protein